MIVQTPKSWNVSTVFDNLTVWVLEAFFSGSDGLDNRETEFSETPSVATCGRELCRRTGGPVARDLKFNVEAVSDETLTPP